MLCISSHSIAFHFSLCTWYCNSLSTSTDSYIGSVWSGSLVALMDVLRTRLFCEQIGEDRRNLEYVVEGMYSVMSETCYFPSLPPSRPKMMIMSELSREK